MIFTPEIMDPIFDLVDYTKGVEQGSDNHPEGDVYTHTMQCVAHAFRETNDTDLILAVLCHDIGKAIETKGHEKHSVALCTELLSGKSLWLVEHHLRVRDMWEGKMKRLKKATDLLYHTWFPELAHHARIDKLGRNPNITKLMDYKEVMKRLNECVDVHFLMNKSYKGRGKAQIRGFTTDGPVARRIYEKIMEGS